jgi:hypothetical protein
MGTMKLTKRTYLFTAAQRKEDRAFKAFHAPQRKHVKQAMPARKAS